MLRTPAISRLVSFSLIHFCHYHMVVSQRVPVRFAWSHWQNASQRMPKQAGGIAATSGYLSEWVWEDAGTLNVLGFCSLVIKGWEKVPGKQFASFCGLCSVTYVLHKITVFTSPIWLQFRGKVWTTKNDKKRQAMGKWPPFAQVMEFSYGFWVKQTVLLTVLNSDYRYYELIFRSINGFKSAVDHNPTNWNCDGNSCWSSAPFPVNSRQVRPTSCFVCHRKSDPFREFQICWTLSQHLSISNSEGHR
jgi:hypothetical protein